MLLDRRGDGRPPPELPHICYDLREHVLPDWDHSAVPVQRRGTPKSKTCGRSMPWGSQSRRGGSQIISASRRKASNCVAESTGYRGPADTSGGGGVRWAGFHPPRAPQTSSNRGVLQSRRNPALTHVLLSPFDPLVWDRQRARELFNFDYLIECYTPALRSDVTAISLCRSCSAGGLSAGWIPRRTGRRAFSRSRRCTWKQA